MSRIKSLDLSTHLSTYIFKTILPDYETKRILETTYKISIKRWTIAKFNIPVEELST